MNTNNQKYNSFLFSKTDKRIFFSKSPFVEYVAPMFGLKVPNEFRSSNNDLIKLSNYLEEENKKENCALTHIFIKGIGGIGKSQCIKDAYDFLKENNVECEYYKLAYYTGKLPEECTTSSDEKNKIVFLDGLDDVCDSDKINLSKNIGEVINKRKNVFYVVSGRNVSFISQFTSVFGSVQTVLLKPYNSAVLHFYNKSDAGIERLERDYNGTPFFELISIPLYRDFLTRKIDNGESSYKTLKEFYKSFVDDAISSAIEKYANSECKSINFGFQVKRDTLKRKIRNLAFKLFFNGRNYFTVADLKNFTYSEMSVFILFCGYRLEEILHQDKVFIFSTRFFYEYFVALALISKDFISSDVSKMFFLNSNQDINLEYQNILSMIITLLPNESILYKKLRNALKKISPLWIFNTDISIVNDDYRYEVFNEILNDYSKRKDFIYYDRFLSSNDMSNNIPDLVKGMLDLLPPTKENDFLLKATEVINNFIKKPNDLELYNFINYSLLLGVYQPPKWSNDQQEIVKPLVNDLIKFFMVNGVPNRLKGAVSAGTFLKFYETYNWFDELDNVYLTEFINNLLETDSVTMAGDISSEAEYNLKLGLFTLGYSIKDFESPLLYYIFKRNEKKEINYDDSIVPDTLDDNYIIPIIHIDFQLEKLKLHYENKASCPSFKSLLNLFLRFSEENIVPSFESASPVCGIWKNLAASFIKDFADAAVEDCQRLYKVFIWLCENAISYFDFSASENLCDEVKKSILKLFEAGIKDGWKPKDFVGVSNYQKLITGLLNLREKNTAEKFALGFRIPDIAGVMYIYEGVVLECRKDEEHVLFDFATEKFSKDSYFKTLFDRENNLAISQKQFNDKIAEMESREESIITDIELLKNEIKTILDFLEKHPEFPDEENYGAIEFPRRRNTERYQLNYLQEDAIKSKLSYNRTGKLDVPIFSQFAVNLLYESSYTTTFQVAKDKLFDDIDFAFSEKSRYWRFIYSNYLSSLQSDSQTFLDSHIIFKNKFKESFEDDIKNSLANDSAQMFINAENIDWIKPFISCFDLLYKPDDDLSFIDIGALRKFLLVPFMEINEMQFNANFTLTGKGFIFDWLYERFSKFGLSYESMANFCLNEYKKLSQEQDYLKAQLLSYLINLCWNNMDISYYASPTEKNERKLEKELEDDVYKIILDETKTHIHKNYDKRESVSMLNKVLEDFWRNCRGFDANSTYLNDIAQMIDEETIAVHSYHINDLAKEVILYFIEKSTAYDRKNMISKFRGTSNAVGMQWFLCALGEHKTQIKVINSYLSGGNVASEYSESNYRFGFVSKNKDVLLKWIELLEYSLESDSFRRQTLLNYAVIGIKNNIDKRYSKILKRKFEKMIRNRKAEGKAPDFIISFWNKIRQTIYAYKPRKPVRKSFVFSIIAAIVSLILCIKYHNAAWTIFVFVATTASLLGGFGLNFIDVVDFIHAWIADFLCQEKIELKIRNRIK